MNKFYDQMNMVFDSGISNMSPEQYVAKMNQIQVENQPDDFELKDGLHLVRISKWDGKIPV